MKSKPEIKKRKYGNPAILNKLDEIGKRQEAGEILTKKEKYVFSVPDKKTKGRRLSKRIKCIQVYEKDYDFLNRICKALSLKNSQAYITGLRALGMKFDIK